MADDSASVSPGLAQERRPRRRWARGVDRPTYLQPGDLDRVMIMLVALTAEVSALRDRLDSHEALAEAGAAATTPAVETYVAPLVRTTVREAGRQAMLKRVLRAVTEDREAALDGVRPEIENVDQPG